MIIIVHGHATFTNLSPFSAHLTSRRAVPLKLKNYCARALQQMAKKHRRYLLCSLHETFVAIYCYMKTNILFRKLNTAGEQ